MTSRLAGPAPIVLLHGWGGSYATTWRGSRLEKVLKGAGREVLELDLPGHGIRPASHSPADYEFLTDQIDEALPPDIVLDGVGFSLGGKLLLQLAVQHPRRFRRLVIGGVGANLFRPEAGEAVSRALIQGLGPDAPDALRSVVAEALASGNDPLAMAAVVRRPPRLVSRDALATIRSEVLLVVGSNDRIADGADPLARAIPSARTIIVEGLDHTSTPSSTEFQDQAAGFVLANELDDR
ncbi:alpha/beta fold hydrolase [Nocardia sp. NPDC004860]|uniref:alpha/beta fold hydrolase n=1 Tax=Nocardia sp. NPDC004860 TaxID=3154557 RepID=UPI0033BC67D2